jgi:hypothetical protein
VNTAKRFICKMLVRVGNSLTVLGCVALILAMWGVIPAEFFAIGISSGIRVVGSVAIAGCLLSAAGYGAVEYLDK